MSKLEEKVITLLKKERIKFIREKTFPDLRKGRFRYDFEIYVDGGRALMEVQGQQHYQYISKFYKRRADFESQKERDRRKISYALAHRIPLYVIPYWELEHITTARDLLRPQYLATSRWKNDIDGQNNQKI
jgi:hypothetical protein